LVPRQQHQAASDARNALGKEEQACQRYTASMGSYFATTQEAQSDLVLQLASHTQPDMMTGTTSWDERLSPYVPVGTLTIKKPANTAAVFQQAPSHYNPWNMLVAHRPLGHLQRDRNDIDSAHGHAHLAASGAECDQCPVTGMFGSPHHGRTAEPDQSRLYVD
jgi:hypothetical protein